MGRPKLETYFVYIDGKAHHTCAKCGQFLSVEENFYPKKGGGGILSRCKLCCKKEYDARPPELKKRYNEKSKKPYSPERYLQRRAQHYQVQRRYLDKPTTKAKHRDRYHSNPQLKMARTLRIRVRGLIKGIGAAKAHSTYELLGCSLEEFIAHIEGKFQDGMTWQNHGRWKFGEPPKWHIDHVIPCAAFDLTDPEQQKACFHYKNLQPLWARDNLRKGDSIIK